MNNVINISIDSAFTFATSRSQRYTVGRSCNRWLAFSQTTDAAFFMPIGDGVRVGVESKQTAIVRATVFIESNQLDPITEWAPGVCKICKCTDEDCSQCVELTGQPCSWAAPNLCSACSTIANEGVSHGAN